MVKEDFDPENVLLFYVFLVNPTLNKIVSMGTTKSLSMIC